MRDEDGYEVDEFGTRFGYCNSCGEEREESEDCCEDGEVVPYGEAS